MSVLSQFLKAEAIKLREEAPEREAAVGEWKQAVQSLLSQLKAWVMAADSEQIIQVRDIEVERVEQKLGVYRIPGLEIRFKWWTLVYCSIHSLPIEAMGCGRRSQRGDETV